MKHGRKSEEKSKFYPEYKWFKKFFWRIGSSFPLHFLEYKTRYTVLPDISYSLKSFKTMKSKLNSSSDKATSQFDAIYC